MLETSTLPKVHKVYNILSYVLHGKCRLGGDTRDTNNTKEFTKNLEFYSPLISSSNVYIISSQLSKD